jgi:hypothetical protein
MDNDNTVRTTLNESSGSFLVSGHSVLTSNWQIRRKLTLMIAQVKPNGTGFILEQGGDNLDIMVVSLPFQMRQKAWVIPASEVQWKSKIASGGRAEIWRCLWTGKDFVGKKYNR